MVDDTTWSFSWVDARAFRCVEFMEYAERFTSHIFRDFCFWPHIRGARLLLLQVPSGDFERGEYRFGRIKTIETSTGIRTTP